MDIRRIFTQWPFRRKLLLLLLIIFLPALGIIVFSGLGHRKDEILSAQKKALLLAQSLVAQQEQIAINTKTMLSILAQLPEVRSLDAAACGQLFRDLHHQYPFYTVILAVKPDGTVIAASSPFDPKINLSDRKHVKDAIRTLDFSVGEYIVGRVSRTNSLNYTFPVLDAQEKLVAILIAGFDLNEFGRFISAVSLPEGSAVVFTDHQGIRLYRLPANDATPIGQQVLKGYFDLISGEVDEGFFEWKAMDGVTRISAFKQLRLKKYLDPYLYITVGQPKDLILHQANLNMLGNLSILGIAALLALSLAWVFGNLVFIKPINQLVAATQRFGRGEMDTRTGLPHSPDELGRLAQAFDDMASQRERDEAERLRFSKLESLSTLAGGIAHDFNNILTSILGNIDLAMLDGKIEPRLALAEQACLRAQNLSQQLLTFAKGGAPIKKIVSFANILMGSATLMLSGSKSRSEFSIPGDLWSVEADGGQINQVINNLLINADQAMPKGGIIKIKAENILVESGSNLPISTGKYVKVAIADQGIGISPQYLDKIFDPYYSTKQEGSGLGLSSAYSIIKNHSGYIQVESQMGVGTTFQVYLPAIDKGVPADEPETVKPTMGQGKVLVMDDEGMIREVLSGMLGHLGYEVDFASNGFQAIERFGEAKESGRPFDAVILDLTVPGGMGGKETLEKLLRIDPQLKAIVSSGYSDDPIMAGFQKYGFSEVIAKPYSVVELSKILHRVISKKVN